MTTPRAMLKSWTGILGFQAIGFAAMVATAMIAVVVVPPSVWGEYWLLLAVVQIASGMGFSWVAQSILLFARVEMREQGDIRSTLWSALLLQAAMFVALLVLAWLARPFVTPLLDVSVVAFLLMSSAVALMATLETFSYALQGDGRFQGLGLAAAVGKVGPLIAVGAIGMGFSATPELLLAGLAAGLASGLAVAMAYMPPQGTKAAHVSLKKVRDIVGYGGWLPIASTAGVLSAWMHVWFVRAYGGPVEAGVYGWAASLYALVGAVLMPLSAVIAPHLIDLTLAYQRERSQHRAGLFLAVTILASVAAPVILGFTRLAASALPEHYAGAGPILVLLFSAVPAQILTYLSAPLLRAFPNMIGRIVVVNVAMAALNIGLNFLLTTRFGGTGAALSLAVSIWFGAIAFFLQVAKVLGVSAGPVSSPITILTTVASIGIVAAIAIHILAPNVAAASGVFISVLLLVTARRFGLLRALSVFGNHLSFLPVVPRRILTSFCYWCNTSSGKQAGGGTV